MAADSGTQCSLVDEFDAHVIAVELESDLSDCDDPAEALLALTQMAVRMEREAQGNDLYRCLQLTGLGLLHMVSVWKFADGSLLVVGWSDADHIAIGVLPPGTEFMPLPYDPETNLPVTLQ